MSHFNVAVFTTEDGLSVDELLAPYDEELTHAPHLEFTKQEAIIEARNRYPKLSDKSDDECWKYMAEGYITDKHGNLYSSYNPDAKWDWWVEGGRWSGLLRLKDGSRADSAKLKDIDFSPDEEVYKKALRFWGIVVEHAPLEADEENPFTLWNEEYYRDFYGDRENYARRQAQFSTQAVVTQDGIWCERGAVGWFGSSDETPEKAEDWDDKYFQRFIEGEDPELTLTIVDCHI